MTYYTCLCASLFAAALAAALFVAIRTARRRFPRAGVHAWQAPQFFAAWRLL
jgi:hypothetical protein